MEALALPGGLEPVWAAVPAIVKGTCSDDLPLPVPLTGDERKSRIKAGVACGASGQSHRPAVRVGATGCGNFGVAQKWGQNREGDITFAVNIPEALLSQGKNRGQSGDCPVFPERRASLSSDIPSRIAPHETIGPPPKIDTQFKEKGGGANATLVTMN